MIRTVIASALALCSMGAMASGLMDVAPGDTLTRIDGDYSRQAFYRESGTATFVDMHDRFPAYVFFDVGAHETVVGTAWMSIGADSGQRQLFKDLQSRYDGKGASVSREDEITACSAMPGGRGFELKTSMRTLDEGTTLLYSQMPAFSTVSVLRGSALNDGFDLPDISSKAAEIDAHKDDMNSYQKVWSSAFHNQLKASLSAAPDFSLCKATGMTSALSQPFTLGKPLQQAGAHDGENELSGRYDIAGQAFSKAVVDVANGNVVKVRYNQQDASESQVSALRQALTKQHGEPSVTGTTKEGGSTTERMAWTDSTYKHLLMSLQFTKADKAKQGQLSLAVVAGGPADK